MPKLEFVGQSAQDPDNIGANPSRLVNRYREVVGGRSARVLKSVLGTQAFVDLPSVVVRAMRAVGDNLYTVVGGTLYRVASDGSYAALGSVSDGDTSISSNNGVVTIAANGLYYTWNGITLATPSAGAFSDFGSVTFLKQFTILTEKNGRRFQWSNAADPSTLGGLDFATAEGDDYDILRGVAFGGMLWLLKERSIERWYPQGTGFVAVSGGEFNVGLAGYDLIAETPNALFFVGSDGKVYLGTGALQPVSTVAVETSIKQDTPTGAFYYRDEGHEMCVIRFEDRPSWVFDISTGEWHERAEGALGPWSARRGAEAWGSFFVGTEGGAIQRLGRVNRDVSGPLIREATSRALYMDGQRFRIQRVELLGRMGRYQKPVGFVLDYGDGSAVDAGDGGALLIETGDDISDQPYVMLSVSKDYGQTFGAAKPRPMGKQGEYDTRAVWRSLGQFRSLTVKVTDADETDMPIDAEMVVDVA